LPFGGDMGQRINADKKGSSRSSAASGDGGSHGMIAA